LDWKCWAYEESRIIGLRVLNTVVEDIVWWACIVWLFASFVFASARFEEENQSLVRGILFGTHTTDAGGARRAASAGAPFPDKTVRPPP
jgi:hypothetical protein